MSKNFNKIGVVSDPDYLAHDTGPGHPESADRLEIIREVIDELSDSIVEIRPRVASREELTLVHTNDYVDKILGLDLEESVMLDPDTVFSTGTKRASLKAVGGVLEAVDKVMDGVIARAFCAVRPPGHHAEIDRAMGFCIFNNIAVGAAYAHVEKGIDRISIIDWDLHHGNGTQNAFYGSAEVQYISTHQFPFYPGSGSSTETGQGSGSGFTVNIPMTLGSDTEDYRDAFETTIIPSIRSFRPGLILISAGFDAHEADPLGGIRLTTEFYGEMTSIMVTLANEFCDGKIVSVLEGGYNPQALRESVREHLKELIV